ncbi:ABC transporter substrate-binding protein [Bacillus piscicola]|uniref:ABC transporter substrate-binding protein n=1 Tax=Bacillus piscicola TaxID=1632684 RepID=UPI001F09F577|nr:ABC transporter substrate-binding protein [Bacillus piscicola]
MKIRIVFIFLFLSSLVMACSDENGKEFSARDVDTKSSLVLAIGGEPEDGFDPTTGWGRYGSPLFQSTLLTYDQDFTIQNDLATTYKVSDDGRKWTVTIRKDVMFSDGEALTAEDVVFTYKTAKTSGSVIDLDNLEKVEKTGDDTIHFYLKKPESTFIYLLSTIGIVPKHAYDQDYNENPIGSGPFEFVQWDKGQQLIVKENEYYYGEKPSFKNLTFLFLSEDATFAAAKSGEVDIAAVPPTYAKEDVPGMRIETWKSVDNRGIMFPFVPAGEKTKEGVAVGNDVTADKAIRQAINVGIDRQALVDGILDGYGTPAYTAADRLPWWNPDTVIEDGDMERAKDMLEDAGWIDNGNGIREKNGIQAAFTLLYPAGDQLRQSLSIAFADMIRPLGIDVKAEGKSWRDIEKLMYSHPVMMGWGSHDPLELYNLFSSNTRGIGHYNSNYYSNQTVDAYMEKALRARNEKEANQYWQKAQWDGETGFSAQGDAPWAWLVNVDHVYYVREGLHIGEQKIQPHGHGWPLTDSIAQWEWDE